MAGWRAVRIVAWVGLAVLAGTRLAMAGLEAPPVTYPALPPAARTAEGFTPDGWKLEVQASGDLDGDGIADLALVLRAQDPRNVVAHDGLGPSPLDTNPRILAVALGRASGGYGLVLQNHRLIPRHVEPTLDDPFDAEDDSLRITRGTLRLTLHFFANAGSWTAGNRTFTFRHQNGRFALIGFDSHTVHRASGETRAVSANFSTRRVKVAVGNIESDAERVRWRDLPAAPLVALDDIDDAMGFEIPGLGD